MTDRVEELEIRLAFQEDLLQSLDREVHSAHQLIARLQAELLGLRGEIDTLRAPRRGDAAVEPPPPHY